MPWFVVKTAELNLIMAIQRVFLARAPAFFVLLVFGSFAPAAAQSASPWDELDIVQASASPPTEPGTYPFAMEHGGSQVLLQPFRAAETAVEHDAWAGAFAEGSRPPLAGTVESSSGEAYPVALNPQVQFFLDRFTGSRREVVNKWVGRASRYLAMIRDVLRSKGLPEDLAFTAMIESGFNPLAVSRAGAKGMWQFMAGTARRYGLRVDQWVDERLDPVKATHAAASYLRDLHNLFGSWSLAQAAYNAGELKVSRAIRATGSNDFWRLAESRHLHQETKEFVPQIHAATLIGRDPDRYGFDFAVRDRLRYETLTVPPSTDLTRLASAASLEPEALRYLNSSLVRGVTPPGSSWELRVPEGSAASVRVALARKNVAVASVPERGKISRVRRQRDVHVVRQRDTVTGIARRYGVSVGDVMKWNSLDQHDRIRPGDRLRVTAR